MRVAASARRSLKRAHFDRLYFYPWGCNAMNDPNNNPGLRMLRDGGFMEGTTGYQAAAPYIDEIGSCH
jgi:hypothetical protein